MASGRGIGIELVYATPAEQVLLAFDVPEGATIEQVIELSSIAQRFPNENFSEMPVGVWGRPVERAQRVRSGDRVELYRPLSMDPRDARRVLAADGKSMGAAKSGSR